MTGNPNGIRPAAESSESGRSMVCVVGAHSGVGVSTVSANLALCAQRGSLHRETALLDLNLYEETYTSYCSLSRNTPGEN